VGEGSYKGKPPLVCGLQGCGTWFQYILCVLHCDLLRKTGPSPPPYCKYHSLSLPCAELWLAVLVVIGSVYQRGKDCLPLRKRVVLRWGTAAAGEFLCWAGSHYRRYNRVSIRRAPSSPHVFRTTGPTRLEIKIQEALKEIIVLRQSKILDHSDTLVCDRVLVE
jgi:hypothetical protein